MRSGSALLLLAAASCGTAEPIVPAATRHPVRVMSMNQCADQLVLALLPPARIASVSWLARDPNGSLMADAAVRVPVNHGQAEEVIAERPDLVVAGSFTTPALRGMLKRLGYPVIEVDQADSIADIRRITRQVAAAVDERARGEALIADMDAKLAALARDPGPPVRVVAWDGTGFAAGEGSLYDVVLRAAGARNLGNGPVARRYRRPDVEVLMRTDPALLVEGSTERTAPSRGDDVLRHRVVRHYWGNRTVPIAQNHYVCGTPMVADAAVKLRDELRSAAAQVGPAPPIGTVAR